jgi:hypothetical protein
MNKFTAAWLTLVSGFTSMIVAMQLTPFGNVLSTLVELTKAGQLFMNGE